MDLFHHHPDDEKLIAELRSEIAFLRADVKRLERLLNPPSTRKRLSFIKIRFTKDNHMAEGAVTLSAGQSTVASIDYFDQVGNPMPTDGSFTPPAVTYSIDNSGIASSTPASDGQTDAVSYVSAGVANLTATVQGPAGPLTDTETVTCSPVVLPTPVLSSVKINFSTPTP